MVDVRLGCEYAPETFCILSRSLEKILVLTVRHLILIDNGGHQRENAI